MPTMLAQISEERIPDSVAPPAAGDRGEMKPYYQDERVQVYCGENEDIMPSLPLVDSIVTDPPYGWSFMGKKWDYDVPSVQTWRLALDRLKPGGHALVACGTRTQHRMAVNLEDAGFEIRDLVAWVYGAGFPKSMDISKAIDKMAGAEREVVGKAMGMTPERSQGASTFRDDAWMPDAKYVSVTAPATPAALQWQGWGTALKPAMELWTLCRKPIEGTVAQNVLKYGTGGLNIDGCRVEGQVPQTTQGQSANAGTIYGADQRHLRESQPSPLGRFPANLIHDGSEEVVGLFPQNAGAFAPVRGTEPSVPAKNVYGEYGRHVGPFHGDSGSAARFFYCAKTSREERDQYLDGAALPCGMMEDDNYPIKTGSGNLRDTRRRNDHPTVKPIALMRYLCRLITPPGGIVLDPFFGTGTTALAARLEGFRCIGIERDEHACEIAAKRMSQLVLPL